MDLNYKHSKDWLCQQHSFDKIKIWINTLTSLYFIRAFGGHANDPDLFKTRIVFADKSELDKILSDLNIDGLNEFEPFGHRTINGAEWFVTIDFDKMRIGFLKGTDYNVTDSDFEAAKELDKTFKNLGLDKKVDREMIYDPCCVTKERYKELSM